MKVGAMMFVTDCSDSVTDVALATEERGFESLFVPEKTHVPISRRTRWPGGVLPDRYKRCYDPFVALSAAAAVTGDLLLGTGVALVPLHDPILLAKQVASLDQLSRGRFIFGIGYGWNVEELADHGVEFANRQRLLDEKLEAMRALWSHPEAGFRSAAIAIEPSWAWPQPIHPEGPPVLIGARFSPWTFAAIARVADGWMPIEGYGDVLGHIPKLRSAFEAAGRNPDRAQITVYSSAGDRSVLERYAERGVSRVVVSLPSSGGGDAVRALDDHVALIDDLRAAETPQARSA
jgi:probable F420-dependent oxidoreductase